MPGPPKTPTAKLLKRGSWRADDRPDVDVTPLSELPEPPGYMCDIAVAKWIEYGDRSIADRTLARSDLLALEMLAVTYADWRNAEDSRERMQLQAAVLRWVKEFGLTPSSRAGVPRAAMDKANALDSFKIVGQ